MYFLVSTIVSTSFAVLPENFGDLTGTGCSSAWKDYCEVGWSALGAKNSSDMCKANPTNDIGVLTTGRTGSWPNGVSHTLIVPTGEDYLRFHARWYAVDKATVSQRMVFTNSSGAVISTISQSKTTLAGEGIQRSFATEIPAGSAKVKLQFGVTGSGGPMVFLDWVNVTYPQGEEGDEGGVEDEDPTCTQSACDTNAANHCAAFDVCPGYDCGNNPILESCTGRCQGVLCYVDTECRCDSPLNSFTYTVTP